MRRMTTSMTINGLGACGRREVRGEDERKKEGNARAAERKQALRWSRRRRVPCGPLLACALASAGVASNTKTGSRVFQCRECGACVGLSRSRQESTGRTGSGRMSVTVSPTERSRPVSCCVAVPPVTSLFFVFPSNRCILLRLPCTGTRGEAKGGRGARPVRY